MFRIIRRVKDLGGGGVLNIKFEMPFPLTTPKNKIVKLIIDVWNLAVSLY